MKTTLLDFLICGFVMICLWTISAYVSFFLLAEKVFAIFPHYANILVVMAFLTGYGLLSGIALRLMLKVYPVKMGDLASDSFAFTYWKLLTMVHYFGTRTLFLINVAPAYPFLGRLYGAKIGRNVALGGFLDSPFLISLGDNCIVGLGAVISGNVHFAGRTTLGPVVIGPDTTIGVYSMLMPNIEIGAGVTIAPNSVVVSGTKIPDGETWKGNPARKWQ